MTVTLTVLIPARVAEDTQTVQYVSTNATTIIDKFTATNFSAAAAVISINIVTDGESEGNANVITKTRALQPSEVYIFPEIVGQVLLPGGKISTLAGTANAINIRASGRSVT